MVNVPFVAVDSLAIFLIVVPSPWHFSAWNSATCYMMMWTLLGCVLGLVGNVVWAGNLSNPAPTYCDIATKLQVGLSVAIPLASLCINRRLFNIATFNTVVVSRDDKRRNVIIDTILALVLPIIFMAVHYTMQGHRYDIVEDYGCWPSTYDTAPAYILVFAPPIVVSSISLVYCSLSIRSFFKRRNDFNELLRSSSSGLTSSRYFRLMALASAEIIIGMPISLYFFISDLVNYGVQPWISWADTHSYFSHINYYPTLFFTFNPSVKVSFEVERWAFPFIAFLFFAFFGFADEARRNYRKAYYALVKHFGILPPSAASSSAKSVSIFGKYFGKRGLSKSSSTSDAVMVSLPRFSTRPPPPSSKPHTSVHSLAECELTMPTLDLTSLDAEDKMKGTKTFSSGVPDTPQSLEHFPFGVRKTVEMETHVV